ncbi:VOC family protein [Mycobacteroides salmoniphilum]|uniref:VOC family protein n=1 Tax=Mycobacteroides salmoniphilum TaxID=404941 RepID=UPI000994123E|nr:VOC family protein [Mycobacteroides salmoniphilum]
MEILSSRILLRPKDYDATLAFYRDTLGLAVARDYGAGMVFFAGQSLIEIAGHGRVDGPPTAFPGALWLQVRDVYAVQADLESRGAAISRAAQQEPWGLHEMHVAAPDGVTLIFVQIPPDHPLRKDTRR